MDRPTKSGGFNELALDHFQNPRNCGELVDADAVGLVRNGPCGDLIKLYLKLEGDRIIAAQFKTYGCGAAIASSSALTELLVGKTISEALKIKNAAVAAHLGGLPENKITCSQFAETLIKKTLDRAGKTG